MALQGSPPFVPASAPSADEAVRRRLARNRRHATALLVLMGLIFVATHLVTQPGLATMLVRASAEAGIAGGLADWFAVTALFRHPLGLPIPHTAIIPNSKERIARTLGRFFERHFFTEEALLRKLRAADAARRLADWLAAPQTAPTIARLLAAALPPLINSLEKQNLHDSARRILGERLRETDFAPILGRIIHLLTASGE